MSVPPERITIKRRRQEEPVDMLVFQDGPAQETKRRFTDFFFQRLRENVRSPLAGKHSLPPMPKDFPNERSLSDPDGIPSVRSTAPGDEIKDFAKFKATQNVSREADQQEANSAHRQKEVANILRVTKSARSSPASKNHARRFHLSRGLSSIPRTASPAGVRKYKSHIRPSLATFVERHSADFGESAESIHKAPPVDKIVQHIPDDFNPSAMRDQSALDLESVQATSSTPTGTFVKPRSQAKRFGQSINDHPSTWDYDSEQLADELAALAMELDPDPQTLPPAALVSDAKTNTESNADSVMLDQEGDYVYETYVRMRQEDELLHPDCYAMTAAEIGILVIEEKDQDLWERYIESDEDTEWDEEDSNAEDNPANDYPEDEVSSDDEYGHNVYQHRQHGSDDEQFDDQEIEDW